jgi:hypothetical protein
MKKWILFPLTIVLIVVLFFAPYLFQNFTDDEKIILARGGNLPLNEQLELRDALSYNNEVRKSLYENLSVLETLNTTDPMLMQVIQ